MPPTDFLKERVQRSQNRLQALKKCVSEISELKTLPGLCVYVTGSYGRLEASRQSDLDLFFVYDDKASRRVEIGNLTKILIDAKLIQIARRLHFPDFSNEGKYLEIHKLGDMLRTLGGPEDDYKNYFTARLLLLLESQPVYNRRAYSNTYR